MPDIDAIRRSRLKKKTLFAMDDEEDIVMARAEYMRLADALWRSVSLPEAASPNRCPTARSSNCWGSIDADYAATRDRVETTSTAPPPRCGSG
jgi:hypothetical protein